jgi:hypothetical protein
VRRPARRRPALRSLRVALAAWPLVLLGGVPPAAASEPAQVEVGVWFNGVHTIDFLDGSFGAEFYLWWISEDPDFRPFEILQVLNGRQWSTRAINRRDLGDGRHHTSGYVSVIVNHDWNLLKYPFDRQKLRIILETPFTASELRLLPDVEQSVVSEFVDIEGYQVTGLALSEHIEEYQTDFGFKDSGGQRFSRLVITLDVERESGRLVIAILIGFIVANLIALLTYTISITTLPVRATMIASAIFCAVGNMNLLNGQLNPAVGSLLVDRFALGSFGAIVIALTNSIVVDRLAVHGRAGPAKALNWIAFSVVMLASVTFYALSIAAATR